MKQIIALLLWLYMMDLAVVYGSIWDSKANPSKNVTVTLEDGRTFTGDLSKDWNKLWVLETADGATVMFKDFTLMATPLPKQPMETRFFSHVRALFPMVAVATVCLLVWAGLQRGRNNGS